MNTKTVALIITLSALTVVLSPAFLGPAIPAPFLPVVSYHIYEIPIVVAFFLIGPKYGFTVAILNAIVLQAVFPNSPFIRPLPNLLAVSSMLVGVYFAYKLVARRVRQENARQERRLTILATASGILCRVTVMETLNYVMIQFAVNTAGVQLPPMILVYFVLLAVFDITLTLYTIPTGYLIARTISKNLNVGNKIIEKADYQPPAPRPEKN